VHNSVFSSWVILIEHLIACIRKSKSPSLAPYTPRGSSNKGSVYESPGKKLDMKTCSYTVTKMIAVLPPSLSRDVTTTKLSLGRE
jgi:hypothetical protein